MFEQIFLSPQMKRSVIISKKHVIYELPHELQTTQNLASWEIQIYYENLKT